MSLPTSVNPSLLFVLVFNACLVAACFSSDSSSNPGNAAGSEDSGFTDQDIASTMESTDLLDDAAIAVVVNPSPDTVESSPNPAPDPLGASQPDIDTDAGVTVTEESVSGPVGPDIARVQFNMTVPAYKSDALQVEIDWSSGSEQAQWVIDENWTATIDFPSNNGFYYYFNVRFPGNNGQTVLGSCDMPFSYEDNAGTATVVAIDADDFDTIRWDDDQDGATNLNELRAGTDPDVSATRLRSWRPHWLRRGWIEFDVRYSGNTLAEHRLLPANRRNARLQRRIRQRSIRRRGCQPPSQLSV